MAVVAVLPSYAQQKTIKGQLVDAGTGQPIANAAVNAKASGRGTVTDAAGNFNLKADSNDSLIVSSLNYLPQTIFVGNQNFI